MNYFEVVVSVRQENTDSKGNVKIKKVKKCYLIDALTVTEAEARVVKIFEQMGGMKEFQVLSVNGSKVVELYTKNGEDTLYEAIVEISLESTERVKKTKETYLVESDSIKEVQSIIEKRFKESGFSQDYEVVAIKKSKIAEIVNTDTDSFKGLEFEKHD
jgi:hypothetical protein